MLVNQTLPEVTGLSDDEVLRSRARHGAHIWSSNQGHQGLHIIRQIVTEPMFILLTLACSIYLLMGEWNEGLLMIFALLFVGGISLFQTLRSKRAIDLLHRENLPLAAVIRNGELIEIPVEDLVVGDIFRMEEGQQVPADGKILHSHDLTVDESILTGEAFSVFKNHEKEQNQIFFGTAVTSGSALAEVNAVGRNTALGQIGKDLGSIEAGQSPLQGQIQSFVRGMAIFGTLAFLIVWLINYFLSQDVLASLLHGLTLAMSMLPEEIPVAFSAFMAIGAWRLIRHKVLTKHPNTVESLGSATVICLDKTGTITENRMQVAEIFDARYARVINASEFTSENIQVVLEDAMWSSEPHPFDPMEIAIHKTYQEFTTPDARSQFTMIHEYPLDGKPPMMTHIYEDQNQHRIVAAKGGFETIMEAATLSSTAKDEIRAIAEKMATKGYRVLGTAHALHSDNSFPKDQLDFHWQFSGLIALNDPPKTNIRTVIKQFHLAEIAVKMVTGDHPQTALAIAKQIGIEDGDQFVSGEEIMEMTFSKLRQVVQKVCVFARVFPEAKLRIIQALRQNEEVVAMTGDGVNDAPALKAADIGVAMGERGTAIAQRAASLILIDDDLQHMVYAIRMGRRIYNNLKKAIQYIISIHIPIILVVTLPLILGWRYPNIFSPIHVIFLELIMGPTCSIVFENEPAESNIMKKRVLRNRQALFSWNELSISILQGLVITLAVLWIYHLAATNQFGENLTRTMVFTTLVLANIFLTLENRSFDLSILETLRYKNPLMPLILILTISLLVMILAIPAWREVFHFAPLNLKQVTWCLMAAFSSVVWIEGLKFWRRRSFR